MWAAEAILISGSWVFGWAAGATWAILRNTEGQDRLLLFYNNNDWFFLYFIQSNCVSEFLCYINEMVTLGLVCRMSDLSDIYLLLNLFSGLRDTLLLIAAVGFQIENLSLKLIQMAVDTMGDEEILQTVVYVQEDS